jgi:hypothetical protein
MSKFLVKYDFEKLIDEANLNELTDTEDRLLNDAIDAGVEEVAGYVRHRYDYDQVFKVVQPYAAGTTFAVNDRVFWSPTAWSATATYANTDVVSFDRGTSPVKDEQIYQANQSTVAGESPLTAPSKWDLLAANNTFYTCSAASTGNLPTNTSYFTAGDNRNAKIVQVTVDVTLYNIHSKISPRNIPDVRRVRYDGFGNKRDSENAIRYLEKVQKGDITPNLPIISTDDQNTHRAAYGTSDNTAYKY